MLQIVEFAGKFPRLVICSLLAEVSAVLLTVENNEVHVVSSVCAVPISAGGKCCQWVCTTGLALTNQQLQLSCNDHYLGGPPLANNVYSSVGWVVVSCTPGHVKLMSFHRPVVLHALSSSRGLQSLDCDLGADCKYYADNKDVCSDK